MSKKPTPHQLDATTWLLDTSDANEKTADGRPLSRALILKGSRRGNALTKLAAKSLSSQVKLTADAAKEMYRSEQVVEPFVPLNVLNTFSQTCSIHAIALQRKARVIAGLGIKAIATENERELRQLVRKKKRKETDPALEHWDVDEKKVKDAEKKLEQIEKERKILSDWIDTVGDDVPLREVLERGWYDFEALGWLAFEVVRNKGGKPAQLVHLPAHLVRIAKDRDRFCYFKTPTKKVWFKKFGAKFHINAETGEVNENKPYSDRVEGNELIFWVQYSALDPFYGVPGWYAAMAEILGSNEARDFMLFYFTRRATPTYALTLEGGTWGAPQLSAIKNFFRRDLTGDYHATLLLETPKEGKIVFQKLTDEPRWIVLVIQYLQHLRDAITSAHGLSPALLGVIETASLGAGCIIEGTMIYTDQFGIEPIEELVQRIGVGEVKNAIQTIALNQQTGVMEFVRIAKTWKFELPREKTRRVDLSGGIRLETSDWHPFYVFENGTLIERRADEIKSGDKIVAPTQNINWSFSENVGVNGFEFDAELAWLAGYILGDGHHSIRRKIHGIQITDSELSVIERARDIIVRRFGLEDVPQIYKSKGYYDVRILRKSLSDKLITWFEAINLPAGKKSKADIGIPVWIAKSPVDVVAAFVAGLLDSDGTVLQGKDPKVRLVTCNRRLMEGLAALLNVFGFRTQFAIEKHGGSAKDSYAVKVGGRGQLIRFAEWAQPFVHNPLRRARLTIKRGELDLGSLGVGLSFEEMRPLIERAGVDIEKNKHNAYFQDLDGVRKRGDARNKITPRKRTFRHWFADWKRGDAKGAIPRILEILPEGEVKSWCEKVLPSLVMVKSIVQGSGGTFYDFTVPEYQNYVAGNGGFVVAHNTGDSQLEIFKALEAKPRQETLEGLLNNLLVKKGLGLETQKLKLDELDVFDEQLEVGTVNTLFGAAQRPTLTLNEARKRLRYDPIDEEWADEILMQGPGGMVPLSHLELPPPAQQQGQELGFGGQGFDHLGALGDFGGGAGDLTGMFGEEGIGTRNGENGKSREREMREV